MNSHSYWEMPLTEPIHQQQRHSALICFPMFSPTSQMGGSSHQYPIIPIIVRSPWNAYDTTVDCQLLIYGGFHKWGYPQIIYLNGIFPNKNHPVVGVPPWRAGNPHMLYEVWQVQFRWSDGTLLTETTKPLQAHCLPLFMSVFCHQ